MQYCSRGGHLQLGAIAAVEELGALDDNGINIGGSAADEHAGGSDGRSGGSAISGTSHIEGFESGRINWWWKAKKWEP